MPTGNSTRWLSHFASLALLAVVAAGCFTGEPEYHLDDAVEPGADGDGPRAPGSQGDDYTLEAATGTDHALYAESSVEVGAQLFDGDDEPVQDQMVDFEIIDADDADDTDLGAGATATDDEGIATNDVRAGEEPGDVTVRASHPRSEETVDFQVSITTVPPGHLEIGVDYEEADRFELATIEVDMWRTNTLSCAQFTPTSDPGEEPMFDDDLATHDETTLAEDLNADDTYTVAAAGIGPQDQISAHGCIDGVEIEGDETTQVDVPIDLFELMPIGVYDVTSTWDFTEALQAGGPIGQSVADVLDWVSDPGQAAADYLAGLAVDWVCDEYGTVSSECGSAMAAESTIADEAADFLNDAISSIPGISDLLDIGQSLVDTVENAKVDSILTIEGKTVGEDELAGQDIWNAVTFEWGDCDSDPDGCEEIELGLDDSTNFGVVQADWDGRLYDYDQLEIDPHDMVVPYGEFMLYILQEHLIPAITGGEANSIGGAFDELLCSNLGSFSFMGFTIDASTIQDYCTTAFSTAGIIADSYLAGLEYDIDLAISGEGHMIDLESNGDVDLIDDGIFYGELVGVDGDTADMEAEFTGERAD